MVKLIFLALSVLSFAHVSFASAPAENKTKQKALSTRKLSTIAKVGCCLGACCLIAHAIPVGLACEKHRMTSSVNQNDAPVRVTMDELSAKSSCVDQASKFSIGTFSKPVRSIWFYGVRAPEDFLVLEHQESGKTLLFGARAPNDDNGQQHPHSPIFLKFSNQDLYDRWAFLPESKILKSADKNREIGAASWYNVYNAGTAGPLLDINPNMSCQVQQANQTQGDQWHSGAKYMRMHCRKKRSSDENMNQGLKPREHNFHLYQVGAPKAHRLCGEIIYEKDTYGQAPEKFCLKEGLCLKDADHHNQKEKRD